MSTETPLTAARRRALEQVFAAEIADRLPFQSNAKLFATLVTEGLLAVDTVVVGHGMRFPVTVTGYCLTHAGRYAYCMSCKDVEGPPLDNDTPSETGEAAARV